MKQGLFVLALVLAATWTTVHAQSQGSCTSYGNTTRCFYTEDGRTVTCTTTRYGNQSRTFCN